MSSRKNLPKTRSEARRLIKAGAVRINGKKVFDPNIILKPGDLLQIGKGTFIKVK